MNASKAVRQRTRVTGGRGSVQTERTTKVNGEERTTSAPSREIEEPVTGDIAYVSVNGGLTKNMGNFNSVKIGVSVSLPCGVSLAMTEEDVERVRETYNRASALVDDFMDKEYQAAIEDVEETEED